MTPSIVIDSSVLVSFFLEDDSYHEKAVVAICKIFNSPEKPSVIIPPLVLYETGVATIRASADPKEIAERLFRLINIDQVTTIQLSDLSVFKHLQQTSRAKISQPQLRTHDMLIVGTALDFKSSVASFDQQMVACCQRLGVEAIS